MITALVVIIIIAAVCAGLAGWFFYQWQLTLNRLHNAEKEALKLGSFQDLEDRFKTLSQTVLDRQEERGSKELRNLLQPVRDEVTGFRAKVEEYLKESRSTKDILNEKFQRMDASVTSLSGEANQLVAALRGSAKVRGDWGEVLLRQALENAGLREGDNFDLQYHCNVDGQTLRPDAVVRLPNARAIVIDAKVSLIAYADYARAADDQARNNASKEVRVAFERQIGEVTKYLNLPDLQGPGFAIMFTPIEPAWQLMVIEHQDVMEKARQRGVIILGPVNLLVALKVVEQLWLAERKERSVRDIVNLAVKVQDAVGRLVSRVEDVTKQLETAMRSIEGVHKAISGRRGILVHAHKLQDFGVKGKEELPEPDFDADDGIIPSNADEDLNENSK